MKNKFVLIYLIVLNILFMSCKCTFTPDLLSIGFVNDLYIHQAGKISMDYSTYFCDKKIDENGNYLFNANTLAQDARGEENDK